MLAVSHRSSEALPTLHRGVMEESGTINPAALNAPASTIAPNLLSQPSPRGIKRSRSPSANSGIGQDPIGDDAKTKSKKLKAEESPVPSSNMSMSMAHHPVQTPHTRTSSLPHASPSQASPARSTPGSATKPPVVKALPTVRDHTTDQLNPEGDEYQPREIDPDGETKVSADGHALGNRKFKCRTFQVPNRGEKLFMLATECARVLGYRDSYLLFNKNRSLYKIIANQTEKDNLIYQDILPYSYRSRQIAIVTARSMFRQFGSRLIEGGRRVRDDYWEAKARKQGFTEEDAAGEKRPGAAKQRELQAAQASQANSLTALPQGQIIYNNDGTFDGQPPGMGPVSLAPLPMIHLPSDELRASNLGGSIRPRQEIAGPAYTDRIQQSSATDILTQAGQAAEYNKQLGQTRAHRAGYLDDYWRRPHEQPVTEPQTTQADAVAPPTLQAQQTVAGVGGQHRGSDSMSHAGSQMIPPTYAGYSGQTNQMTSPVQARQMMPPSQMHQGSPSMSMGAAAGHRQTPSYGGYPQNQMWPPPQPQPSPLSQSHGYGQQQHSQMPPPQMPGQPGMGYSQLGQMGAYAGMNRSMYQPGPGQQQYSMGMQSGAGQQPGMYNPASGNMSQYYGGQQ
ncbi:Chromatin structure-remodeling complex subunit rsc7 [Fulvia fulva]|nr:Chromatin structure-remodeling complex subunit rsc7 [Fulvia fulva]KAK4637287.1 Chromatin structure-remodeling complex subunit rsc7 [Fulvia fulva]WPV10377.1 Chromatin structure-remodeling complex subunit rsc7 [Fulvia fulva]WPV24488.1 Chromatin structure-remodeling complex subunit rsc7 [Fulvia fulva]